MEKTLVVWRRFGKEHGEGEGFRINPPSVVEAYIRTKLDSFRRTPDSHWAWWRLSGELLYEKPLDISFYGPHTRIFYLPSKNWAILRDVAIRSLGPQWTWYVHIGDISFEPTYGAWIFTDYFVDVIVQSDGVTHSVLDLDDLALAAEIGLISTDQVTTTFRSTQELIDLIRTALPRRRPSLNPPPPHAVISRTKILENGR